MSNVFSIIYVCIASQAKLAVDESSQVDLTVDGKYSTSPYCSSASHCMLKL